MARFFLQPGPSDGKDTHIQFHDLAWNNINFGIDNLEMGARTAIKAGEDIRERVLLEFDLSGVPAGLIVDDARLHFHVKEAPPNITTWEIRRLIQDFTEGVGGAGNGASGTTHDGSTAWLGGAGALGDTDAGVVVTFTPPSVIGAFSIDIKTLVVDAINNRSGILRMFIRDTNEVPATDTRFVVQSSNKVPERQRPKIVINHDQGRHNLTMGVG